jgi:hypothetical protein
MRRAVFTVRWVLKRRNVCCDAVYSGGSAPTFSKYLLHPSRGKMILVYLMMEVACASETTTKIHGVRYHKTAYFILTATRKSNVTEGLYTIIIIIIINFRRQAATLTL